MGRRSVTGTKAGKFMNPTDQARKEARRKELKKNKKQRLIVRQAVIKQKDPKIIFAEMETIDKMEYDANNPPPYSVKVLQDKRRKLKDTWLKIYQYYQREDPTQAHGIKRMEQEYEQRRVSMMTIYESVMQAQRVKIDDIPLPDDCMPPPDMPPNSDILTLIEPLQAPKSILKPLLVSACYDNTDTKQPPGPPPGPPPPLTQFECNNDEFELGLTLEESYKSQEKPKKIRFDTTAPINNSTAKSMQPAPPPVTATTIQQSLLNKAYSNLNRVPPPGQQTQYRSNPNPNQNPPAPQHSRQPNSNKPPVETLGAQAVQIQAQPVLRNKLAEVTRFVPTSLTVRRDTKNKPVASQNFIPQQVANSQSGGPFNYMLQQQQQYATLNPLSSYKSQPANTTPNSNQPLVSSMSKSISIVAAPKVQQRVDAKDEAYLKFMKEMEGLF